MSTDQDWKPVVIRGKSVQSKTAVKKAKSSTAHVKPSAEQLRINKVEKIADGEEVLVTKTVPLELRKAIQRKRQDKGWTQKDLANNTQIAEATIREYENGKAIVNQAIISKLVKVLGPLN